MKRDRSSLKKKLLGIGIPLAAVAAACALLVTAASSDSSVQYGNITSADYEVAGHSYSRLDAAQSVGEGYEAVCRRGDFTLYVNPETSGVAVLDARNGQAYYTALPEEQLEAANPYNADAKAYMLSNFVLTAVNMETGSTTEYTMYDQLQGDGKFSIEAIENGVRITYVIGRIPKTFVVPQALSQARYEELTASMEETDAKNFANRYQKLDISNYFGSQRQEYLEEYPACETETVYILNSDKEFILRSLQTILETVGYTDQDKAADEAEVMAHPSQSEAATVFRIPLEFTLNERGLSVAVPKDEIRYSSAALPVSIELCPYLMSAGTDAEGYLLLPDGSGSLMELNNGKTDASAYTAQIYGIDPLYEANFDKEQTLSASLPVFGMKTASSGIFARIRESEADAAVKADVSGRRSDRNYASVSFKLFGYERELVSQNWTTSGNGTIYTIRIQDGGMIGRASVDYAFLEAQASSYADMAALYRTMLQEEGVLGQAAQNSHPLLLNVLGAYDYTASVLGIPVEGRKVMTTFEQAQEIVQELYDSGLRLDMQYLAAVNGGYRQTVADGLSFASGLGGSKGFDGLSSLLAGEAGQVYLDISFTKVYENTLFDSFQRASDSVAMLNTKHAPFYEWDPVSFYYVKEPHYYLTPSRFSSNMQGVLEDAQKLGVGGLSLRSIGQTLYSDCDTENFLSRPDTQAAFTEAIGQAKDAGVRAMYQGGNAYVLASAEYLAGLPSQSNGYRITDQSVPFYQMVVHGLIPYSYSAVNTASDPEKEVLFAIATGARVCYTVSYQSSSELKGTDYTQYYNTAWDTIKDSVAESASLAAEAVEATYDKQFLSFEYLTGEVTKSVFSGGIELIVNFGGQAYQYGGETVPPGGYRLVKGSEA